MIRPSRFLSLSLIAAAALTTGCKSWSWGGHAASHDEHDESDSMEVGERFSGATAEAAIEGKSGSSLTGRARFTQLTDAVLVEVWVNNAPPGRHAVHVHEIGDCSSKDGKSAGGHFNPDGHDHGGPRAVIHHAGDLGNMWVEEDGSGFHQITSADLTVAPGTHSVAGRAIVIHEGSDDLMSQPTGAAGGRIGCGEIE